MDQPVRASSHRLYGYISLILIQYFLTGCTSAPDPEHETARLNAFVDEQYLEIGKFDPERLVYYGLEPMNSDWQMPSDAWNEAHVAAIKNSLVKLKDDFSAQDLTPQGRITFRMWELVAMDDLRSLKWASHSYLVSSMGGPHVGIPNFMATNARVDSVASAEVYLRRLQGAAEVISQTADQLLKREKAGIVPPKFVFPKVIADSRKVLAGRPFDGDTDTDSIFLKDLKKKMRGLESLDQGERDALVQRGSEILKRDIEPAYKRLITILEAQATRATTTSGVWKLPDGEDYYRSQLAHNTTNTLDAATIHNIGLREVASIHRQMTDILDQVGFKGTLAEFFEFVRTDDQFFYPNTSEGRLAYMTKVKQELDKVRPMLHQLFGNLPASKFEVKRVEPYRENSAGTLFYDLPTADGKRPGIYYVNLSDMRNLNKTGLATAAFHEGLPGHHLEAALAIEKKQLPIFRRYWWTSSYGEGWAHYAETLSDEMGFFDADPWSRFGYLNAQIYRAVRLVVDTGIHHKKWSREKAIQYLMDNASFSEGRATKEIERYIVWPGQATSYKIGQLKILELRERARTRLGDSFDIRKFHDQILGNGPVPLDFLEELMDEWIEEQAADIPA